jgi:hypothetical protein
VQLALESICGIAETISLERKKLLVPEVNWEEALEKIEKRKKAKRGGGKHAGGANDEAEQQKRVEEAQQKRMQNRSKGRYEMREGQIWASGSEPQLRYKHYQKAFKNGE